MIHSVRPFAGTCRVIAALIGLLCFAAPAAADLYQWTDKDGVVYYTTDPERVPAEYRAAATVTRWAPREPGEIPPPGHSIAFSTGAPIFAEAHLNGIALTLVLDTGASRTIISPAALARSASAVATGRRVRLLGVAGTVEAPEFMVPRLDFAGTQIGPLVVIGYDVPSLPADGLLGRDVLDQFTVTIDPARGQATIKR